MLKIGFSKNDITPRVGVQLAGFGPFLCRHSIGVRDRLWARAMAMEQDGVAMILVSCDLVGVLLPITNRVRELVALHTGLPEDAVMIVCSHTHSGPSLGPTVGWGEPDPVYIEMLPSRIAKACVDAWNRLEEATVAHAEAPCEGVGLNREYDRDAPPLDEVLREDWRPAKPELTDTTCHVLRVTAKERLLGFVSYFGCHPVTCCQTTRYIHGDYAGVATNLIEREHPGSVGLFLQGANGDVNSCVVHKPEREALIALDVIASRYARAVRLGLERATPITVDRLAFTRKDAIFTTKDLGLDRLRTQLAEREARLHALDVRDQTNEDGGLDLRMDVVWAIALRKMIAKLESGESVDEATEVYGMRIGPVSILGSGFETFQAIKNDVVARAGGPITLVTSVTNDVNGYAPDKPTAAKGGYAADLVPVLRCALPFADIHRELTNALLNVDQVLNHT
jgi:neutral/alkaline ceramidase-like enzyme